MAEKKAPPPDSDKHYHDFHAKAHLLKGELKHPVKRVIKLPSELTLKGRKGGHQAKFAHDVNIDGLIHLQKGHTRVSGGGTLKHKGWITLATSVLEGLNVFEVVAADRVVSQVSTEHEFDPELGHIPSVTFLGSHFDNLRINGYPLGLTLNLGIVGSKPPNDESYLHETTFLQAARAQIVKIAGASGLPKDLQSEYAGRLDAIDKLLAGDKDPHLKATCSLVQSIDNANTIPVPGIRPLGHVLVIPEFGWVALGEVEVGQTKYARIKEPCVDFGLTMLKMILGCIGGGGVTGGGAGTNGAHHP
jgi:hypothetical protein